MEDNPLLPYLKEQFEIMYTKFSEQEKFNQETTALLNKILSQPPDTKRSAGSDSSEETYSFIVDEKAEDNLDDLNITKTFGTKLPSAKDPSVKELPPRKSMMEFKAISDDPTVRTYIQGAPVQDNIFLSELNIGAVTAFIYKVSTYQQRWKISITVGWNISESIVHLLANLKSF